MSTPRLATGVSLALHAAMVVALALTPAPLSTPPQEQPARVMLWVPSEGGGPIADLETGSAGPTPAGRSVSPWFVRPPPLPEGRLRDPDYAPASQPVPEPAALRPLPAPASPVPPARPPLPTATPDRLPDPAAVLAEVEPAAPTEAAGAAATQPAQTGRVEAVSAFGRRRPRAQPLPQFPEVLRRTGREAEVTVRVRIDPTGAVVDVTVEQSSGDTGVDAAAVRAVRGYLFERTEDDTIDEGVVTFHFRLQKGF